MGNEISQSRRRNSAIDFVRALCLLLIVLAHVDAPRWLQNIRCFDVVCLVFLSGMSYEISARSKNETYIQYIFKRIKKLLIPTYVVLTLIFITVFIVNHSPEPIGLIKMIESYLLYNGIGYVWFVRVTLMLAAVSPILLSAQQKITITKQIGLFIAWIVAYVGMIILYNSNILPFWPNLFLYNVPIFLLGYGIVYAFGMQYHKNSGKTKAIVVVLLLVCGFIAYICGVESASSDKYPPGMLYLSWGGICAIVLYELFDRLKVNKIPRFVLFLSRNSFDVYLFHIIPLLLLKYLNNTVVDKINSNWIVQYAFVLGVVIVIEIIYNAIRNMLKEQRKEKGS